MLRKSPPAPRPGAAIWPAIAALTLLSACAGTRGAGNDAGCQSYAEARLTLPAPETLPQGAWGLWIADLDDRMTGTCR